MLKFDEKERPNCRQLRDFMMQYPQFRKYDFNEKKTQIVVSNLNLNIDVL